MSNLYAGQEATVRTGHGTTDWFQIGKGVCQGCIYHLAYLTYMQSAAAAKSLQSCLTLCDPIDGTPPGSSVPGILQEKILEWVAISFSTIASWQTDGETMETVTDYFWWGGSKITATMKLKDACSLEEKL